MKNLSPSRSTILTVVATAVFTAWLLTGLPSFRTPTAQAQQPSPAASSAPTVSPEENRKQVESADGKQNIPGDKETGHTKLLSAGADTLQKFDPVNSTHATVCGLHFYSGHPDRQVIAHHFCSHLNDDVLQCVIYDTNQSNARLIGVEYIISEKLFKTLPEDEKKLWHSHRYEVKSGQLVALHLPDMAEKALMKDLETTYGKTWHFWQVDRGDELPLGIPQLMMGFTDDGQANQALLNERNKVYGVDPEEKKKDRADLPMTTIQPGADDWEHGTARQLKLEEVPMPAFPGASKP